MCQICGYAGRISSRTAGRKYLQSCLKASCTSRGRTPPPPSTSEQAGNSGNGSDQSQSIIRALVLDGRTAAPQYLTVPCTSQHWTATSSLLIFKAAWNGGRQKSRITSPVIA